ncbi:ribonuclease domain-containing protein [Nitrincola sp. A-D6]|uniref:ribonuclease domain-containing protein n=1 Tax=Nitrincola sp. A-D6 TaxID=1545442 RepID=UPI00190F8098|nr:ribonuclease domain-containing protein [Nitrincola sp. A-D6]
MKKILFALVLVFGFYQYQGGSFDTLLGQSSVSQSSPVSSQQQALQNTLKLIKQGGPFPYDRDGITFENRERRLPNQPRGYYREYTVDTPGLSHRGPRRVVTGGNPPVVYYYTEDHYHSFVRIDGR